MPITKKYKFESFINYSNKFLGKKLNILYLDVEILLSGTSKSKRPTTISLLYIYYQIYL